MVVCKVSVRGMFIGHRSVRFEEKCGLNLLKILVVRFPENKIVIVEHKNEI